MRSSLPASPAYCSSSRLNYMASLPALSTFFLLFLLMLVPSTSSHDINAIYSLGDSIADTGNLIREGATGSFAAISHLPYGETTFKKATGRCSDGLLMIDDIALYLGLPLLNPYLEKGANFSNGVNFAVAGATALSSSFFEQRGLVMPYTNSSLDVQLGWFLTHLSSICSSRTECAEKLKDALVLVGEIGGNDYNYAFFQRRPLAEVVTFVPQVVWSIINAAKEVIDAGATRVVVPGNFPIGCMPSYLSAFQTSDPLAYDHNNCLIGLNGFAMTHNAALRKALFELKEGNPHVNIMYADYYNAFMHLLDNSDSLGFDTNTLLKACCGTGGEYNYDATKMCGAPGVSACSNPRQHISWDGIHLTEAAYKTMAKELIQGLIPIL